MQFEWYHWAILGVVMVTSELLLPTLVLVWFGLGALVVALCLLVVPDMPLSTELIVWIVVSVSLVYAWFKVFQPWRHKTLAGRSSAQVIGEIGLLIADVAPFQKSKVRFQMPIVGAEVWECVADEPIKVATRVKVVSVDGTILKVAKLEETT